MLSRQTFEFLDSGRLKVRSISLRKFAELVFTVGITIDKEATRNFLILHCCQREGEESVALVRERSSTDLELIAFVSGAICVALHASCGGSPEYIWPGSFTITDAENEVLQNGGEIIYCY